MLDSENIEPSNKKIVYITAIYGSYEATCKKFAMQTIESDFICFTDNPDIISNGWIIDTHPYHLTNKSVMDDDKKLNSISKNNHTFNIAKYYKQNFYNIPRLKNYDCVVWLDGTIEIINENTSKYVLDNIYDRYIIGWSHDWREGYLIKEVIGSDFNRYTSTFWFNQHQPFQNIYKQYVTYLYYGYEEIFWHEYKKKFNNMNFGVWVTCFVAFHNKNDSVRDFLNMWYNQTLTFSTQDQIGFPYVCQKTRIIPLTLPNDDIKGEYPNSRTDFYIKHQHNL